MRNSSTVLEVKKKNQILLTLINDNNNDKIKSKSSLVFIFKSSNHITIPEDLNTKSNLLCNSI